MYKCDSVKFGYETHNASRNKSSASARPGVEGDRKVNGREDNAMLDRTIHLVDSIPTRTSADVCERVGSILSSRLYSFPDGETEERHRGYVERLA